MILGKQVRTSRSIIVNMVPLSRECESHTPPAITARMKEFTGQAIVTEMMTGVEKLEAKFKLNGSVSAAEMALGKGFSELIDIIVSDIGHIGDNGMPYVHTYIYATRIKSIVPDTADDGTEAAEVTLSIKSYEKKMDGVTVHEIDGRTGLVMIGGNVIVPAVI